jgi:hypothetical protein
MRRIEPGVVLVKAETWSAVDWGSKRWVGEEGLLGEVGDSLLFCHVRVVPSVLSKV